MTHLEIIEDLLMSYKPGTKIPCTKGYGSLWKAYTSQMRPNIQILPPEP